MPSLTRLLGSLGLGTCQAEGTDVTRPQEGPTPASPVSVPGDSVPCRPSFERANRPVTAPGQHSGSCVWSPLDWALPPFFWALCLKQMVAVRTLILVGS